MKKDTLFKRTTQGDERLAGGTDTALTTDQRSVLALVNGRRSVKMIDEQLLSRCDVEQTLETLLTEDLIMLATAASPTVSSGKVAHPEITVQQVEQTLQQVLGPIAGIVMGEALERLGSPPTRYQDFEQLVAILTEDISDPEEAQRFITEVLQGR